MKESSGELLLWGQEQTTALSPSQEDRLGWLGFIGSHRASVVWSGKVLGRNHNFLLRETPQIGDFWLTVMYARPKKKKIYIVPEWFPWLDLQTWDSEIRWLDTLPAPENWERKAGRPGDADGLRPGLHSLPRLLHVCAQLCLVRPPFLPSDLNLQIPSQSGLLPLPFPNLLFISLSPPNRTHIVLVYLLPHHLKVPWGQRFWSVLFTSWTLKCLERCQAFNGHSVDICWASA